MKIRLIYYKNLVDAAFEKMFASIGCMFTKTDDGEYVFAGGWSQAKTTQLFVRCLQDVVHSIVVPCTKTYDKYIIIGSCWPKDNLLLKFKDNAYFPKKLEQLVVSQPEIKYLMREKDIHVDLHTLNTVFISTFNKMFKYGACSVLGNEFKHVMMLSHSHLDCYALFKISKWTFGNSNCVNVWKEQMQGQMQHLVAVNELIAKYVQKKTQMNKSDELKQYAKEVKGFLREKLGT